ncbi:hypothetical protein [Ensifer sp. SSB1]|jgi:hypothetical protein|uniref:hypothetical protein n=1 Tax=Ensifer sp. SSB1 TaxID=2795385 RepID=UPI001A574D4C|nr:hypothetical protein [Ensifer sp. SSB1]MBK5568288.1 hypothetical protein [Ensifer sp. SSB1]
MPHDDTTTIIPFPRKTVDQPLLTDRQRRLAKLQATANRSSPSMSQAIPQAMAMCAPAADRLPDPAIVAQVVIGFAKRKGIAMASVPKIFREQLLTLCASGDPTALMLRDWLEGNRNLQHGASQLRSDQIAENEEGL